ncbi:exocyst complex component EXO84B-like [Magnolia sinica]|uniref:exocyst complex component EXO84B-like n=1 Tax=Magnolia sinica TaxID=86752 RepID=UPI00265A3C9D|nr:exocyst complex component EXO84B-like [Magnolia sinica]
MGSTSRFRFRDQGIGDSTESESNSESSSVSGLADDDSELESMTGKGIKRLCSELLELKKASDDDFHRSVYSNYSEFIRIMKEAEVLESELMELKKHLLIQRKLLRDLKNGIYLEILPEESTESYIEEYSDSELCPLSQLETLTCAITETLDILLSEHRLDEALIILEREHATLQQIQSEEDFPPQIVTSYNSEISERRKRLADQFSLVAEHPRTAALELQKALSGLCSLGDCHRANLLLFQFYQSRLARGMHDLQCSKSYLPDIYIRELAKFVFSVISQAATSFIILYGETSPYTSELIQWAREETEMFVSYFDRHVKSISETTGGLSLAVESVKHAISFCSLLESQRILLRPYLIKLIRPCMEGVLQMHINHFKKVIRIFATTDTWVLGKFLTSGLVKDRPSHVRTGDNVEYCQLSNSGRKFVTLIQAIIEDVSPLLLLQMESSILKGLADLFTEYVDILKRSIPSEANVVDKGGLRTNSAKTLHQQLSLLVNSATLVIHFFSSIAGSIFKGIQSSYDEILTEDREHSQQKELDNWIFSVQEAGDQLRCYFCQQFVLSVMTHAEGGQELSSETYVHGQSESVSVQDQMPSAAFQVLFLQLRRLEKLAKDVFVGVDWVVEDLLRELIEAVFVWLSNNQEFWTVIGGSSIVQQTSNFNQFLLDVQFLVEIAKFGGYFTDKLMDASLALIDSMETSFVEAGINPNGDVLDDGRAVKSAKAVIDRLLEIEKTKLPPAEGSLMGTLKEYSENQQYRDGDARSSWGDSVDMEDGQATNAALSPISRLQDMEKAEVTPSEGSTDVLEEEVSDDEISQSSSDNAMDSEDPQVENAANKAISNLQEFEEAESQNVEGSVGFLVDDCDKPGEETEASVEECAASSSNESITCSDERLENAADSVIKEIQDIPEPESSAIEGTVLVLEEDFNKQLLGDVSNHVEESNRNSLDLRDGWASNVVVDERTESNVMEFPDMEGYEFVLDEVPDQHGRGDVDNSVEEEDTYYFSVESEDGHECPKGFNSAESQ